MTNNSLRERYRALRQSLAVSPHTADLQNMHDLLSRGPPPRPNYEGSGMSLRNRNLQPANHNEERGAVESARLENESRRTEHDSGALRNEQNSATRMNASDNTRDEANNVSV